MKTKNKIVSVILALAMVANIATPSFATDVNTPPRVLIDSTENSSPTTDEAERPKEADETIGRGENAETLPTPQPSEADTEGETAQDAADDNSSEVRPEKVEKAPRETENSRESDEGISDNTQSSDSTDNTVMQTDETERANEPAEDSSNSTEIQTTTDNLSNTEARRTEDNLTTLSVNTTADTPAKITYDQLNNAINGTDEYTGDVEAKTDGNERYVKLNQDADIGKNIIYIGDYKGNTVKNIILDLNGHSIEGTGRQIIYVGKNSTLTIEDTPGTGSITGSPNTSYIINSIGTIYFEGGTINSKKVPPENTTQVSYGIDTTKNLYMRGGTINADWSGIRAKDGAEINITGGTIDARKYGIESNNASGVTIKDCTIKNGEFGVLESTSKKVEINNCTIENCKYGISINTNLENINITNCTINSTLNGIHIQKDHSTSATNDTIVNVSGGKINSKEGCGITVFGYQALAADNVLADNPEPNGKTILNINNNISAGSIGISGNGTMGVGGTEINITGGTITGTVGIYHPQNGTLTIKDGTAPDGTATHATITGTATGIEMRSGTLNLSGKAIITGGSEKLSGNPEGSGSTIVGAGIAVSQHETKQDIDIKISGGEITGYVSLYQANLPSNGNTLAPEKVSLDISGGQFNSSKGNACVISDNKSHFISGGSFSHAVDEDYIAEVNDTGEKIECIKGKLESNGLAYHVGHLAVNISDVTIDEGAKYPTFNTKYTLNGAKITDVAGSAVVNVVAKNNSGNISIGYTMDKNNENAPVIPYDEGETLKPVITNLSSANDNIATVDPATGEVTGIHANSSPAQITVTLANGETFTFNVTVVNKPAPTPTPTPAPTPSAKPTATPTPRPASSPVHSPDTGDSFTNWYIPLIISGLGLVAVTFVKRRQER